MSASLGYKKMTLFTSNLIVRRTKMVKLVKNQLNDSLSISVVMK